MGRGMKIQQPSVVKSKQNRKGTELGMFLGSDGGVLGVGAARSGNDIVGRILRPRSI